MSSLFIQEYKEEAGGLKQKKKATKNKDGGDEETA
jgi:hypothetical protein